MLQRLIRDVAGSFVGLLVAGGTLTLAGRPGRARSGPRRAGAGGGRSRGRAAGDRTGLRVREGNAPGRRVRLAGRRQGARLLREHGRLGEPVAGAKLVDRGAPVVVLTLPEANVKGYPQAGEPQDVSPATAASKDVPAGLAKG